MRWCISLFFFNDTATTEIYTLSLHDALPICSCPAPQSPGGGRSSSGWRGATGAHAVASWRSRSEEHTSELQSQSNLVCRLLLEKKKKKARESRLERYQFPHCLDAHRGPKPLH